MKAVNLIPSDQRRAKAERQRFGRRLRRARRARRAARDGRRLRADGQLGQRQQEQGRAARQEAVTAENKAKQLGAFTDFASIKQQRLAAVMAAAQTRFDWERFMRELSRVMPTGSWVHTVDASVVGDAAGGNVAAAATTAGRRRPEANLVGCTPRQSEVARMMVRLEQMYRVTDVALNESAQEAAGGDDQPRELRKPLQVRPDGHLQPGAARATRRPRARRGSRPHSEVARDGLDVRPRPQASARDHPDRRDRGVLVPAACAQARGSLHGVRLVDEAGGSAATPPRRNSHRHPAPRPTSAVTTPRSFASARPSRPTSTCPACSCSSRARPRAPASSSRRSRPASGPLARPRRRPTPPAGGEGSTPPAEAGGQPAASAPGQAAEGANDTAAQADGAAAQSGVDPTTSTTAREGSLPVGGGAPATAADGTAVAASGRT